jgi:propanol-preferring alcohol dehydrogenase
MPLSLFLTVALFSDTGAEKKELCLRLGAEKWVDFRETKDLVKDIKNAAGGEGPHAALVSAASVSFLSYGCVLY